VLRAGGAGAAGGGTPRRLAREHWGHGYATEAATGWLDHGFGTLNLPRVISITDAPNLRSLAVMRRLGMEFDHEAKVEDMGMVFQAVVSAITREQWRSGAEARRRGAR
jgi:RimJ/RimL family protein N-acetyltransferase